MCLKSDPRKIDKCIANLVSALKMHPDFDVLASCCGHSRYPMTIIVKSTSDSAVYDLMSNTPIPRSRNFYRKDSSGLYYVPEVPIR